MDGRNEKPQNAVLISITIGKTNKDAPGFRRGRVMLLN